MVPTASRLAGNLAVLGLILNSHAALAAITITGDTLVTPANPNATAQIGIQTVGTLRIDSASMLTSGLTQVGVNPTGIGFATVSGPGSSWNISNSAEVGGAGIGRLNVLDQAVVSIAQSGVLRIGVNSQSDGFVRVSDPGTVLQVGNQVQVGVNGLSAVLEIDDDAIVDVRNGSVNTSPQGRIELGGGLLRANQVVNNGLIAGDGEIQYGQTLQTSRTSRIEVGPNEYLRLLGFTGIQNAGRMDVEGGQIELQRTITNIAHPVDPGEIILRDGTFRITVSDPQPKELFNLGLLAAIGGQNDFYGNITNSQDGRIAVTNNSVMIFHDDVTADGGTITVFPGSSAVFLKDLTVDPGATLLADLAGTSQDTGFGQIEVVGNAQLAGSLNVTLTGGFAPSLGDVFPLIAASEVSGSLSLGTVPALPEELTWHLGGDSHQVVLSVVPALEGDYNANGVVDAADYVLWRSMRNQSGAGLPADGDRNGTVNDLDYNVWASNFGSVLDGAAPGIAAVPEPTTAASILIGLFVVYSGRRKRMQRSTPR